MGTRHFGTHFLHSKICINVFITIFHKEPFTGAVQYHQLLGFWSSVVDLRRFYTYKQITQNILPEWDMVATFGCNEVEKATVLWLEHDHL